MRRKDREVASYSEVVDILKRCDTVRLGMVDGQTPYVVPVSFGLSELEEGLAIYFHCATEGRKMEVLQGGAQVCFEADIFLGYQQTERGITARYESVMGTGRCVFLDDDDEVVEGLRRITEHCGFGEYPVQDCLERMRLRVGRVDVTSITGKRNLPEQKA